MKQSAVFFFLVASLAASEAFAQTNAGATVCSGSDSTLPTAVAVGSFYRPDTGPAMPENFHHSCVLRCDGSVQCFGNNAVGQLGVPMTSAVSNVPVDVQGLPGPVQRIFGGYASTCAITRDGDTYCWGNLNSSTSANVAVPTKIEGLSSSPTEIAVGRSHACALLQSGKVMCWGANFLGQLGDRTQESRPTAVEVALPSLEQASALAAGSLRTCAAMRSGDVYCWGHGANPFGDSLRSLSTPELVYKVGEPVAELAMGDYQPWGVNLCARSTTDRVYCWGQNYYQEVSASQTRVPTPHLIPELSGKLRQIGMGFGTLFAINGEGQLIAASAGSQFVSVSGRSGTFAAPVTLTSGAISFSVGWGHVCAILETGKFQCWGQNDFGQLGDGSFTDTADPRIAY